MLRVAVRLPAPAGRIGDYLADVTALEAAGADSIWPEISTGPSPEPWILLGAIAAVTHRVRLGLSAGSEGSWLDTVATLGRLSSGRVVVGVRPGRELTSLVDQLKSPRSVPSSILLLCRTPAEARRSARAVDGVILPGGEEEVRGLRSQDVDSELWVDASVPADKASWVNSIATLEAAGATGIIVPWDARLIDLLRSAGEPDDRTDLLIATG
jgi:alkanesulfonate monooxygenase SsuD/methylene tetrahydromethanopterin reductase-like flavin-dependent oxidoreductase (luciferase family)